MWNLMQSQSYSHWLDHLEVFFKLRDNPLNCNCWSLEWGFYRVLSHIPPKTGHGRTSRASRPRIFRNAQQIHHITSVLNMRNVHEIPSNKNFKWNSIHKERGRYRACHLFQLFNLSSHFDSGGLYKVTNLCTTRAMNSQKLLWRDQIVLTFINFFQKNYEN